MNDNTSLEIKGLVTIGEYPVSFTCCANRPNVQIDGKSLHEWLESKVTNPNLQGEDDVKYDDDFNRIETPGEFFEPESWAVKYVIQDEPFTDATFNDASARTICAMLYSEHVAGCYSEWTCSRGGIDFLLNNDHSILMELGEAGGKHVWISFK